MTSPTAMRSAIYEGTVSHRRIADQVTGSAHRFSYQLAMVYLDVDELDAVAALHPLWRSGPGPAAVRLTRADLPGDRSRPAAEAIGELAAGVVGHRPGGPTTVLLHPRTWGWLFNPITCAFCFDTAGQVSALVAEVTNTPWHEQTTYVVGGPGSHDLTKTMHVSPFLPMDLTYRLHYSTPGETLRLGIDVLRAADARYRQPGAGLGHGGNAGSGPGPQVTVLHTALHLRRRQMSRQALSRVLWRYPFMTARVSAGIYAQALRLKAGGAVFHPHPGAAASHGAGKEPEL